MPPQMEVIRASIERMPATSQGATHNPQPSTLNPQPSTLNPQPSTLNLDPQTLWQTVLGGCAAQDWACGWHRRGRVLGLHSLTKKL